MEREFIPVKVAVMLVSDAPSTLDEATGKLVVDKLAEAGHDVWPIEVVKDSEVAVRKQMDSWIDFSDVDVIIAISGFETDSTNIALAPLITKQLMGFSDLFRLLTYREIGTAAMLTEVIAAQCGHVFVFALPAARGAVATALEKLLIPQLDCRTRPRNLVMKMMRHKSKVPTTGPMSFPPTENTPFGVPPPPRSSNGRTAPPPPPKRNPATHSTPPMPIVAVAAPPVVSRTISDPNITELDPNVVIEEAVSNPAITPPPLDSMEEAIERSIEASANELDDDFKQAQGTPPPPLDDDDPAVIATREHASKSPEAQAAAWVAAVEEAASKQIKKTAAERAEREARRSGEHKVPDVAELAAAAKAEEAKPEEPAKPEPKPEPKVEAKPEPAEEPRGKIEKATGAKAAPKPDRPVDNVAAVIVDDPELVEKRARAASIKPATTLKPPPPVARAVEATDLPVFPARHATPAPPKSNRGWMMIGGLALIGAIVLLITVMGKRGTASDDRKDNPPTQPDLASTPPPVEPPDNGNTIGVLIGDPPPAPTPDDASADIEMEPQNARTPAGGSSDVARPKPREPREPKEPKEPVNPDDPDLTKAPANPITADECDEVTCILNKFNKPCCERYKPKDAPPPAPVENPNPTNPNPSGGPVELDKTLIRIGVERFRAQIISCGEQSAAKGTVSLSVTVKPDGTVGSVSVSATPDAALGECAANVMRKATFAKTQNGGSFTYPFVF